jgi:tripartite-type tricarboxylate transporter receptor subunit TctC
MRCALVFTLMLLSPVASADTVDDFYRGKDIKLIIGYPASGGGYDAYGRFLAKHLGRFIPGQPSISAQNMPGASSLSMVNSLVSAQPRDGTVIGAGAGSVTTAGLFGAQGARFDARQLNWLGSLNAEVGLVVTYKTSSTKTVADAMARETIMGANGATDGNNIFPHTMNKVLGTRFKVIPGYQSTNAIAVAMEAGEVEGVASWHYSSVATTKPQWLTDGSLNFLAQLALKPHPAMPADVPTIIDLAKTPEQKAVLELVFAQQDLGRPFFLGPGIPADRLDLIRRAFDAMVRDPDVLKDAESMRLEINKPMSGRDIQALVDQLYGMPRAAIRAAAEAVQIGQ